MIKLISLDFWKTIATPNPEFNFARLKQLAQYAHITVDEAADAYKMVKNMLDGEAASGRAISVDDAYRHLMPHLNPDWNDFDIQYLRGKIEWEFCNRPPTILPETITELHRLKANGMKLVITSNTNFISGETLRTSVLEPAGLGFDAYYFSDELLISKPNPDMFCQILWNGRPFYYPWEALHIGDSMQYDGGAIDAGLQFALITGPEDLPKILKKF